MAFSLSPFCLTLNLCISFVLVFLPCSHLLGASLTLSVDSLSPHSCLLLSPSSGPPYSAVSSSVCEGLGCPALLPSPSVSTSVSSPAPPTPCPSPDRLAHPTLTLLGLLDSSRGGTFPDGQAQLHGWATRAAAWGSEGPELGLTPRSCRLETLSTF